MDVVVFVNKKSMEDFVARVEIPKGVRVDYLDADNNLQNIEEYRYEAEGETLGISLVEGSEDNARAIYLAMPEDWHTWYWHEIKEDDCWSGGYIEIVSWRHICVTLKNPEFSKYSKPKNVWFPPATVAINAGDLTAIKKEEPEPLIKGLLGKGESLLVSAPAGLGKSLLANHMAYTLGNEKRLWGQFKIPKNLTSLIIQSEVDGDAQRNRLKKMLSANQCLKVIGCMFLDHFLIRLIAEPSAN